MLKCKKRLLEGARDTICRAYFCDFMEFLSRDIIACAKRIVFLFFCIVRNPQLSKHELSGSILRCTSKQPASITNFTLVYRNLVSASLLQLQKKLFLCFPLMLLKFFLWKKKTAWKKTLATAAEFLRSSFIAWCLMQLHIRPPPMHDYLSIDFVSGFKHDWQEHGCADSDGPTRLVRSACIYPALILWITFVLLSILYEVKRVTG